MKKILLLLLPALLVANYSFAQYKPEKGSVSTEVQFNPFDQNGNVFKLDGLKVRYFFTDNDAFRVKIGFGLKHDNFSFTENNQSDNSPNNDYRSWDQRYKSTSGNLELNLGYERHFDLSKRLSIYAGASAGFNRHFASTKGDLIEARHYRQDGKWRKDYISVDQMKISNGAFSSLPEDGIGENPLNEVDDRASWKFKAAVFTGIDFYVYRGLYLGTELGLGLDTQKFSQMKYQESSSGSSDNLQYETDDNLRDLNVGFYIEPVLRLGWTF